MDGIGVDGPLGLIVGLLDDLFGGRARLHLFDRTTRVLRPVGVDEPAMTAPGPLHRAIASTEVVVEHVGADIPTAWSMSYRAWIPRGECHLVAARIEGGGEVVGVLSVLRSEHTTVPVAEDRALIGALAARLGRSAAVTLSRAIPPDPTHDDFEPVEQARPDADRSEPSAPSDVSDPGSDDPESDSPTPEVDRSRAPVDGPDIAHVPRPGVGRPAMGRLPSSAAAALGLGVDRVEVVVTTPQAVLDHDGETAFTAVLAALARELADNSPARGLRVEFARSGPDWVASIRPKHLADGWPSRPAVSEEVVLVAQGHGAEVDVVANPELGWLIEIRTPAADVRAVVANEVVDVEAFRESGPAAPAPGTLPLDPAASDPEGVDLMAASLGDTSHMVMLAVSGDGRVIFCNDEIAARLGCSVADLLGRPLAAARGAQDAWDEFVLLFERVDGEGLAQQTLSWPHPEESDHRIRWTVSRSASRSDASTVSPVYLCFGVDVGVDTLATDA